jgi:hypothetical protein
MSLQLLDVLTLTLPGFKQSAGSPPFVANPASSPASLFSTVRWDAASSALKLTTSTEIIAGTNVTVTAPASLGIAAPFSGALLNQANIQLSAAAREGNVPHTRLTGSQPISSVIGSSQLSYSRQDGLAPTRIDFQFTAVSDLFYPFALRFPYLSLLVCAKIHRTAASSISVRTIEGL